MSTATANRSQVNVSPAAPAGTVDPVTAAVKKVSTIATLPEVTSQIIATVEDPKSTATQLHRIVSHDPALVTRILKVVNSAFYSLPGQIGSIERAIVLLGLQGVKNIAVAASLGQLFRGVKLCDNFTAKDLWKHCIAVGVGARELARHLKLAIVDEAFLAGMIHDIGILVSLQTAPEALRKVCEAAKKQPSDGFDFCAMEREMIGYDHQMLGAKLAEMWKFPHSCQLVARHHHDPQSLPEGEHQLVWLVYASDILAAQAKQGFNLTAVNEQLDLACLSRLSLSAETFNQVGKDLPALLAAASPML